LPPPTLQRPGPKSIELEPAVPFETAIRKKQKTTHISEFLKSLFVKGRLSAVEIQEASGAIGNCIDKTSAETGSILSWSKAGTNGERPTNVSRDVLRQMKKGVKRPEVYSTRIPFWHAATNYRYEDDVHFNLPYELLEFELGDSNLDDWCACGPELQRSMRDWKRRVRIPDAEIVAGLGIWGDSAPVNVRDSLYVILFNVVTGANHKRHVFTSWSKRQMCACGCKGKCTFDAILKVMVWVLQHMLIGKYPSIRDDGIPFAESNKIGDKIRSKQAGKPMKLKAGCVQVRGDWQFYKQAFNLNGWRGEGPNKRICWLCHANTTSIPFNDSTLGAKWRHTMICHADFIKRALILNLYVSVLFNFPGFVLEFVSIDLMHCCDLGILQYLLGNVLFELFLKIGGVITRPDEHIGDLLFLIRCASKGVGMKSPPINALTLAMIKA
jgi:hypothetical protein